MKKFLFYASAIILGCLLGWYCSVKNIDTRGPWGVMIDEAVEEMKEKDGG